MLRRVGISRAAERQTVVDFCTVVSPSAPDTALNLARTKAFPEERVGDRSLTKNENCRRKALLPLPRRLNVAVQEDLRFV